MDKVGGSLSTVFIITALDLVEDAGRTDIARGHGETRTYGGPDGGDV